MAQIFTIGTSNRTMEEFISLLKEHRVEVAVDVRAIPFSKRYPHFSQGPLASVLRSNDIEYVYLGKELGGFRKEGYETYARSPQFEKGLELLQDLAKKRTASLFCSEKIPSKCHRKVISKALKTKGWKVFHIIDPTTTEEEAP